MKDIRNYLNIVSENKENKSYEFINDLLFESQNYENIFNIVKKEYEKNEIDFEFEQKNIKEEIRAAKQILKRNDRIVWYLKLYRIVSYLTMYIDPKMSDSIPQSSSALEVINYLSNNDQTYNKLLKAAGLTKIDQIETPIDNFSNYVYTTMYNYYMRRVILNNIKHFLSLPISKIQNYTFNNQLPRDILEKFADFEYQWKQARKGKISLNDDYDYEIIKKLPDEWYWVKLDRHYCKLESDAMGHCGNQPGNRSEKILSLRKLIKVGDDKFWEPHLTFILDEKGYLGEMKGKGNDKPAEKYHPYIIELLKLPIIKGIKGGGYKPENNFSMNDLTEKQKDHLFDLKPELADFVYLYEKEGKITQYIAEKISAFDDNIKWLTDDDGSLIPYIKKFKDVYDLVENIGNDSAKHISRIINGEINIWYSDFYTKNETNDFIENYLPKGMLLALKKYIIKEFPEETLSLLNYNISDNNEGDEYQNADDIDAEDITDDELIELIKENDDELYTEFEHAFEDGYRVGTEKEMMDSLKSSLKNGQFNGEYNEDVGFYVRNEHSSNELDIFKELFVCMDAKQYCKMMSNEDVIDDFEYYGKSIDDDLELIINEPYNGWSGFNWDAVYQYFIDYSDHPFFKEFYKKDQSDNDKSSSNTI